MELDGSVDAVPTSITDGSFDCNICLQLAKDPVITICGHLYCWPCLYNHLQSGMSTCCSTCTTAISHNFIIPLYGQDGNPVEESSKIPGRPSASPRLFAERRNDDHPVPYRPYMSPSLMSTTGGGLLFGGTVMLILIQLGLGSHFLPRRIHNLSNERVTMQEHRVEYLFHQIWLLLFWFALFCFLLL